MTIRPRRSVLYMPGANPRALDKARTLAADGLIFDLEDAVAPESKGQARTNVCNALAQGGYGQRERIVRINGLDTPWGQSDLEAVCRTAADAILIPKVERAEQVREASALMRAAGASDAMALWCMLETPKGVLQAQQIAAADERLAVLVMGTSDLAKDLRASHTVMRLPMITSLGLCLLAARAYDLAILDGVHLDLDDDNGFAAACVQGRELGFDGKTLIHPKTIETANEVFAPTAAEIAWAHRVIAAHEEAARTGRGVVVVEGKLIENLHVVAAQRQVALAHAIAGRAG